MSKIRLFGFVFSIFLSFFLLTSFANAYTDPNTMTDAEFFNKINLDYPGLVEVKDAVIAEDYPLAKTELLNYFRNRTSVVYPHGIHTKPYDGNTAENAYNHKFTYSNRTFYLGEDITWNNPSSDDQWISQLVRFAWFKELAWKYEQTSDDKWADRILKDALDFVADKGDTQSNYRKDIDLGFRIDGWIDAFDRIVDSSVMDSVGNTAFLKHIWVMANTLYSPLHYDITGNFGLITSRGLWSAGVYFPEFKDSAEWRNTADSRFQEQAAKHIYDDGNSDEASTHYTIALIGLYASAKNLADANGYTSFLGEYNKSLQKLTEYSADILLPEGIAPQIGDTDRISFNVKNMYNLPDIDYIMTDGKQGIAPNHTSRIFPVSGVSVMRSGWEKNLKYMNIELQANDRIHGHPDDLSVEAYAYGKQLIVDPGRHNYVLTDDIANWVRYATEAHNTIEVDDTNQSKTGTRTINDWTTQDGFDFFDGKHTGYLDITARREITFIKPNFWIVSDVLTPKSGAHKYEQLWHFDPNPLSLNNTTKRVETQFTNEPNIQVIPADPSDLTATIKSGWVSLSYNNTLPADYVSFEKSNRTENTTFDTILYPTDTDESKNVTVSRLALSGTTTDMATALQIDLDNGASGDIGFYYLSHEVNPSTTRTFGNFSYDGKMAYVQKTESGSYVSVNIKDGSLLKEGTTDMISASGTLDDLSVQYNGSELYLYTSEELTQDVTIYAPNITTVKLNHQKINFTPSGNHVIVSPNLAIGAVVTASSTLNSWYRFQLAEIEANSYSNNYALNAVVSASSSLESGAWKKSKLTDGVTVVNSTSGGWQTTPGYLDPDHTEWVELDMGVDHDINQVVLWPRNDGYQGDGFPVDFTISVKSGSESSWTTVVTKTGYPYPWKDAQIFDFATKNARYIKINITKLSPGYDKFQAILVEVEAFKKNNYAQGSTVTSGSSVESGNWGKTNVVDGITASVTGSNGWSSQLYTSADNSEWLEIDMGSNQSVTEVNLYPRTGSKAGHAFPVDFTIQIKPDGGSYETIANVNRYNFPGETQQKFVFSQRNARYVKVTASKLRSVDSGDARYEWDLSRINDGKFNNRLDDSGGYSSNPEYADAIQNEWIQFDLGANKEFNQVILAPVIHLMKEGEGFPEDFTIQVMPDGGTWSTVVSKTGYKADRDTLQVFNFDIQNARYVKVEATKLGETGSNYALQLNEVIIRKIMDLDFAVYASVSTSSSLVDAEWDRQNLIKSKSATFTGAKGWSSDPGYSNADRNEWIEMDLGSNQDFNKIRLWPAHDGVWGGLGFPKDFTVQVKEDGSSVWNTKIDVTGYLNAGISVQEFNITPSYGRYVRIDVTKPGNIAMKKGFRLSEIELLSDVNYAQSTVVNASSSYENGGWGKGKMVDGIPNSISASSGWTSWPESETQTATEWVEIDLGQDVALNEVVLWPRSGGLAGKGFPVDFTIEIKPSGGTYSTVASQIGYPNPGAEAQSFPITEVTARYVKVTATKLGAAPTTGKYIFQLAEIQIFNNSRINATVNASSSYENGGWGKMKAVDGVTAFTSGSNGWTSWPPTTTQATSEWIELDLGKNLEVSNVILWPRNDGYAGLGFPVDFNIEVKPDGGTYTTVVSQTDYPNPGKAAKPQVFSFDSSSARYIRITAEKLGPSTTVGEYFFQLAEIQVLQNKAFGNTVTSGSSLESGGWGKVMAVDGQTYSNGTSQGYSSLVSEYSSAANTEWVILDLGKNQSIGKVVLHPRDDALNTGEGFPVDFTIDVKADGTANWTTVINEANYPNPGGAPQTFTFSSSTARYVRLNATKLDEVGLGYYLQLKQIEVKQ